MELDHFAPTLGQNGTPCAICPPPPPPPPPPNGMFHFINVVQAVLWLTRLTYLRLAQIIAAVNNIDSIKSKHS